MTQVTTPAELAAHAAALQTMFDRVLLADPAAGTLLDPATLAPVPGLLPPLPALGADGRAWLPTCDDADPDTLHFTLYWGVTVAGRSLVLAAAYALPPATAAAGLLRTAQDPTWAPAVLARLEGGHFLLGAAVEPPVLEAALAAAHQGSRRQFNLSLSRRGQFSLCWATAAWAETGSWQALLNLAAHRLGGV